MNITPTVLVASGSFANQSSYTTASYTPDPNKLTLAMIYNNETSEQSGGGTPPIPSLSGNGLTWTQVVTRTNTNTIPGNPFPRLTIFRAVGTAPTTGAMTIDFAGNTQADCLWQVLQIPHMDIGGVNGANAIVQTATNIGVSITSITATLAAFQSNRNITFGAIQTFGNLNTVTPGSGFTEITEASGGAHTIQTQYKKTPDTTVDWSFATESPIAIAMELRTRKEAGGFFALL